MQEAYVQGVQAMGHERHLQQPDISQLCTEVDEKVKTFLQRPLEGDWPYLPIDVTYVKVRKSASSRLR